MAKIEIIDPSNVLIDDAPVGAALDAVRNHPTAGSDIQRALDKWHRKQQKDASDVQTGQAAIHQTELNQKQAERSALEIQYADERTALEANHQAELERRLISHQAELQQKQAEIKALEAKLQEAQAVINALGGTDLGIRMKKEKRRAELEATKAAIEAELNAS